MSARALAPGARDVTLPAVVLGSSVVFLDSSIVNVALDAIGRDLPTTVLGKLEGLTYVTSGYLATLAALLILAGALGDRYGRRRLFRIGLAGFGVASLACGAAPTMEVLVVSRLVQGAMGALLVPGALAIITARWDGEARGRAIGIWASSTSAIIIVGPLIGGLFVQALSWRLAFAINVPVVILAWLLLGRVAESRDEEATGRFDGLGAAVVGIGVGLAALIAFPFLMVSRRDPLVPPDLFRSRAFSVINGSTFVIYGALYMNLAFQQLFYQGVLGYTPLAAAMAVLPSGVLLVLLSTRTGRLAGRLGARSFLTVGPSLMATGALLLARAPSTSTAWLASPSDPSTLLPPTAYLVDVLPAQLVYGTGLAIMVAPLSTALMASVPTRRAGLASAINNAVSRAGAPLVGALLFIAVSAVFYPVLASLVPGLDTSSPAVREAVQPLTMPDPSVGPSVVQAAQEASTTAFHLAMVVVALLLASGAAINWFGLRARSPAPTVESPEPG